MTNKTVELDVEGMTCGHCVAHVKEELGKISTVGSIDVILNKDAASRVTVALTGETSDQQLRDAIDEAGYAVTEVRHNTSGGFPVSE